MILSGKYYGRVEEVTEDSVVIVFIVDGTAEEQVFDPEVFTTVPEVNTYVRIDSEVHVIDPSEIPGGTNG